MELIKSINTYTLDCHDQNGELGKRGTSREAVKFLSRWICDYANKRKNSLILPDQDILTALYGDKVKVVDTLRYNLSDRILVVYNADLSHKKIDVSWVRENGVIIHYCGKNKPWKDNYVGTLGVFYQESKQCE